MKSQEHKDDLIKYRLEQAGQALRSAENLLTDGDIQGAINRSYYAMFYMVNALAVKEGYQGKTHSGQIRWFQRAYIATGVLPKEFSDAMSTAFNTRMDSDYEEMITRTALRAPKACSS